jgi:hypothetical protein
VRARARSPLVTLPHVGLNFPFRPAQRTFLTPRATCFPRGTQGRVFGISTDTFSALRPAQRVLPASRGWSSGLQALLAIGSSGGRGLGTLQGTPAWRECAATVLGQSGARGERRQSLPPSCKAEGDNLLRAAWLMIMAALFSATTASSGRGLPTASTTSPTGTRWCSGTGRRCASSRSTRQRSTSARSATAPRRQPRRSGCYPEGVRVRLLPEPATDRIDDFGRLRKDHVPTWLWIVIIVVVVLAVLGYFGRGRFSR